jgi:PIN domain nuclease of toxin-antitoxin system
VRYLVDTHILIWSLLDPAKIEPSKKHVLLDRSATKLVSKISYWEISLEYALGKLVLKGTTPEQLLKSSLEAGYHLLDVSEVDLATFYRLPANPSHKDPFDRLLVWQCLRNDLVLVTADDRIGAYTQHGLKLVY